MSDDEKYSDSDADKSSDDEGGVVSGVSKKGADFGIAKGRKNVILPKIPGRNSDDEDDEEDEEEEEEDEEDEEEEEDEEDDDDEFDENKVFDMIPSAAVSKKKSNTASNSTEMEDLDMYDAAEESDEEDYEDDDETGKKYLQKFDELTKQNIIGDYHPELHQHNHDEIESLAIVVRDEHGNIVDTLHRTLPFLTKYERARILGERARQLDSGAKALVEIESGVIDSYLIALSELEEKKIPFIVKRPLMNGGCEYWRLKDLEFL